MTKMKLVGKKLDWWDKMENKAEISKETDSTRKKEREEKNKKASTTRDDSFLFSFYKEHKAGHLLVAFY